ncbi:hypothetical protein ACQR16_28525 [Bradyrhizobium oligotrophicum]|uniref:hypothetical protein n=1 Tax=Bradyrhizobium oligotrophicum TaxID=44255 RepID=UPI003EBF8B1D
MKSTVVIVAVTLALAILLAASLLVLIERRGELSLSPLTEDDRVVNARLMQPPSPDLVAPVAD